MRKIWVVTLLLGLGACGGGGIEGEMKGWKDKMCKCADKECADKTMTEYNAWTKGKREAAKDLSEATMEKIMGYDKELKACRRKLRDGGDGGEKQPGDEAPGGEKPAE